MFAATAQSGKDWVAYTLALPFVDAAAAVAALALAYQARAGAGLGGAQLSMERYIALGALVMATWLLMLAALGLYDRERLLAGTEEYARVFQAGVALPVAVAFADFVLAAHLLSRDWLISFWPGTIVFAGAGRMLARMAVHAARRRGAFRARVIIVESTRAPPVRATPHRFGVFGPGVLRRLPPGGRADRRRRLAGAGRRARHAARKWPRRR